MHLLLTNDDGVAAPGLLALWRELNTLGHTITIVAPANNMSAVGHRKTLHKPLRIDATTLADGVTPAWSCSGSPADGVALALKGFLPDKVDLVVSGINPNFNLAQDLTYSGTVTAAMEAVIAGVPGVAVSTQARTLEAYAPAAGWARRIVCLCLSRGLPTGVLLNLNVPKTPQGLKITRQGRRIYHDVAVIREDPRGRPYYWIGGDEPTGEPIEGTDVWAVTHGWASLTPLDLDLTAHHALAGLQAFVDEDPAAGRD